MDESNVYAHNYKNHFLQENTKRKSVISEYHMSFLGVGKIHEKEKFSHIKLCTFIKYYILSLFMFKIQFRLKCRWLYIRCSYRYYGRVFF